LSARGADNEGPVRRYGRRAISFDPTRARQRTRLGFLPPATRRRSLLSLLTMTLPGFRLAFGIEERRRLPDPRALEASEYYLAGLLVPVHPPPAVIEPRLHSMQARRRGLAAVADSKAPELVSGRVVAALSVSPQRLPDQCHPRG
jgi:hypothetical protein